MDEDAEFFLTAEDSTEVLAGRGSNFNRRAISYRALTLT
jgi:hypothetical protein